MRDTAYATERATAKHGGARLERIFIKESRREEIRFSWWKGDRMMMRPLDVTEDELLALLAKGLKSKVFTETFVLNLIRLLLK